MNPIIVRTTMHPNGLSETYKLIRIIKYQAESPNGGWSTIEEHDILPEEWRFLFKRLYMHVVLP
jgi:hypothetical protein